MWQGMRSSGLWQEEEETQGKKEDRMGTILDRLIGLGMENEGAWV